MPREKLHSQNIRHLLLPSTGQTNVCPTMNSVLSTLRFRLTFISYANPVGRKTFVTVFNVQPSSFVSLLLCQSLWRGVSLPFALCLATLLYQVWGKWETFATTTLLLANPIKYKRAHFPYFYGCNVNGNNNVGVHVAEVGDKVWVS